LSLTVYWRSAPGRIIILKYNALETNRKLIEIKRIEKKDERNSHREKRSRRRVIIDELNN